jgi:hypothetical protein
MTLHYLLGLSAVALLIGFIIFTFRQGSKVKPDPNYNSIGGLPPGGGAV